MIEQPEFVGLMVQVYQVMERMDKVQRKQMLGAIKQARVSMDLNYPNGKVTLVAPTTEQAVEILKPAV
jgi:hypothetical protein